MTSAFISYSHHDSLIARYLDAFLSGRGVEVFIDELSLRPGIFWVQLAAEIRKRDFFIVLLSPSAARSKWVPKEVAWAFTVKKEQNIIPINLATLSEHDWEGLFVLVSFQQIDLTEWPRLESVAEALAKLEIYMGLPSRPLDPIPHVVPFEEIEEREGMEEEEEEPWLSMTDIQRLLDSAQSIERKNHFHALYLYRQAEESLHDYVKRLDEEELGNVITSSQSS